MEDIKLKVSLLQMDVVPGQPEKNLFRAEMMIKKAMKQRKKPNVLVLPEMWTTGRQWADTTKQESSAAIDRIRNLASQYLVNIVAGSVVTKGPDQDYLNSAYIINRQGEIIATYDQVHCERQNRSVLSPGDSAVTFDIDGIRCGIILGYDLHFPEFVRRLALKGAKVLFVPGMWGGPQEIHWKLLNIVRSIENQFFVAATNRAGKAQDGAYPGMSMVVNLG